MDLIQKKISHSTGITRGLEVFFWENLCEILYQPWISAYFSPVEENYTDF